MDGTRESPDLVCLLGLATRPIREGIAVESLDVGGELRLPKRELFRGFGNADHARQQGNGGRQVQLCER